MLMDFVGPHPLGGQWELLVGSVGGVDGTEKLGRTRAGSTWLTDVELLFWFSRCGLNVRIGVHAFCVCARCLWMYGIMGTRCWNRLL